MYPNNDTGIRGYFRKIFLTTLVEMNKRKIRFVMANVNNLFFIFSC